ncbi:N-acetylmuramoyl-L-alanine amidase [Psychrobium sp. 1_MG-2023]|uniref:N-acetylmuramoyl-L-alanine amidase n=1 Tax=Psychrobium sp. 1_MG-2023 TaxID=3062624 RepID=UPI000C331E62|nr:N-acetylmuramoyl-L-alanine amidase [Psychrobium sp. 1_MG-2023]MDP2559722.1 N-acetylmuramoyl-L-alanine amidase [Psychrobium sp. 1_MG-2023]PKF59551.1 N-acetylmuramoyl-L-alanine amidase [Alteromonadales bacterium alter-6D02]
MAFRTLCIALVLFFCSSFYALASNKLQDVRVWPSPDKFRVVFDLTEQPTYSHFSLVNNDRLVIDFKGTTLKTALSKIKIKSALVKRIRQSSSPKKGTLRLVIDLKQPIKPRIFALPPTGPYGDRLVIDLPKQQLVAKNKKQEKTRIKIKTDANSRPNNRDIVIAIDAGHGGEDPGSIGASGRYEKRVTLDVSKMLAKKINSTRGLKAVLTRTGDYYVGLNRRSEIARKAKSDLLLSVHADAFTSSRPSGASILVLSTGRAKSEVGRLLEDNEKHSELLGGVGEIIDSNENEKYLARALIDMSMDNSMDESYNIAQDMLKRLGQVTKLHKKKPALASLAVLKSPDFPSLLVEIGFMSNPQDEKKLYTKKHRKKLVDAIFSSVNTYFKNNPPDDSLYANYRPLTHRVARGESLSVLAKRYNTSITRLKKENSLRSTVLRIGQVLNIPQS